MNKKTIQNEAQIVLNHLAGPSTSRFFVSMNHENANVVVYISTQCLADVQVYSNCNETHEKALPFGNSFRFKQSTYRLIKNKTHSYDLFQMCIYSC